MNRAQQAGDDVDTCKTDLQTMFNQLQVHTYIDLVPSIIAHSLKMQMYPEVKICLCDYVQ